MRWHPSEMHLMDHMQLTHAHAMHMPHPAHWFHEHPMALAFLLAGLVALLILGLMSVVNTGIRMDTIDPFNYPTAFPFYPVG